MTDCASTSGLPIPQEGNRQIGTGFKIGRVVEKNRDSSVRTAYSWVASDFVGRFLPSFPIWPIVNRI